MVGLMVGLILFAGCVGWWAGSNAPLIMSTIRPVDVPEPYYTVQQNDSLELNDLDVSLRDLKMPHKYEKNVFDCGEKAAYVEWGLQRGPGERFKFCCTYIVSMLY